MTDLEDSARKLFRKYGYRQTSLDQIAADANVSRSTLIRYFPKKTDLIFNMEFDAAIITVVKKRPKMRIHS